MPSKNTKSTSSDEIPADSSPASASHTKSPAKGSGKKKWRVGCVTSQVNEKKRYVDLPESGPLIKTKVSSASLWQGFNKKSWFPFGVFDSDGELLKKTPQGKNLSATITIKYHSDHYKPIPAAVIPVTASSNGVFWHSHFVFYVFGEVTLHIAVNGLSGCEAYERKYTIDADQDGNGAPPPPEVLEGAADSKSKSKSKSNSGSNKKPRSGSEADKHDEAIASKKPGKDVKDAATTAASVPAKAGKKKNDDPTDGSKATPKSASSGDKKRSKPSSSSSSSSSSLGPESKKARKKSSQREKDLLESERKMDRVNPVPELTAFSSKNRFHTWPTEADGERDKLRIEGPQQFVNLTHPLVSALLNDKTRVTTDAMKHNEQKSRGAYKTMVEKSYAEPTSDKYWFNRPTANEIFAKLARATVQSEGLADILKQMQHLFEYFFEDSILYAEERPILRNLLERIRADKDKFANHFGPIYFLRFVVLFTSMADTITDTSSSNRNSDRFNKTMFAKSQVLLHAAVKELDDNAHAYFV